MWALAITNVFSFIVAGYDKYAAVHGKRRIRERTLVVLATALGGIGVISAFLLFRHKTKHYVLFYGILTITLLEYAFLAFLSIYETFI